ncbi:MAG: MBL fold metallo-hydrolase [Spirochaetales bacterium]|nr:MBL fold metallo-hydrolase [Spirochaetales bacterium]
MKVRKFKKAPIDLTNNGQLSIFFIGVGSAFSKTHYQTNMLIIKGNDHLMVDCGTKTPQALYELGISVMDIRNFCITHSHADHIGGLEEVMLMNRYAKQQKANIIISEIYQQILWDTSLRGGSGYNEDEHGKLLSFGDFWDITQPRWLANYPRETYGATLGSMDIKIFRTKHIPDSSKNWETAFWSSGLLLDERIMLTADTRFDRELLDSFCEKFNIEAIFHDCQFFDGGVHASISELATLPADLRSKIFLTHYGDNWKDFEQKINDLGFAGLTQQWCFYDF